METKARLVACTTDLAIVHRKASFVAADARAEDFDLISVDGIVAHDL